MAINCSNEVDDLTSWWKRSRTGDIHEFVDLRSWYVGLLGNDYFDYELGFK